MAKLILTNSYFSLFPILNTILGDKVKSLDGRNLIFCEEKVSLMIERSVCSAFKGSFNTEVYSFGNFLRVKRPMDKLLSKEGSAMAVKRILSDVQLKCFKSGKSNLAPKLFELIMQLKSAKITAEDVMLASSSAKGILKNKLLDVAEVFSRYERFIEENGFNDQSSALSFLPDLIRNDQEIKGSDVYLIGFSGWTKQIRTAIEALLDCAKSVTAILVEGKNELLYVNETADYFRAICQNKKIDLEQIKVDGGFSENGKLIVENVFNPLMKRKNSVVKNASEDVVIDSFKNPLEEINRVAEVIKTAVLNGECRYRDFTIALGDVVSYRDFISTVFNELSIPYFLDEQKSAENHPMITLIISYVDCFRKNLERKALSRFYKNPLFEEDKSLSDAFENYLIKYNVNYGRIKEPFIFDDNAKVSLQALESFRERVAKCFEGFSVQKLLSDLNVKAKLDAFTKKLEDIGEGVEASKNALIFDSVLNILSEMQLMLKDAKLSFSEFKSIFLSGVSALKLSPLPQFNDAVFIGDFKQTALAKAKRLFVVGLTSEVPATQADVSLLSDDDIDALQQIKVLVEPKIKVVNHRNREAVGMALSAFSEKLYLSYPTAGINGKKNVRSEIFTNLDGLFIAGKFPEKNGYLTGLQGMNSFANDCGDFAEGKLNDLTKATSFYQAFDKERLRILLDLSNKEIKEKLDLKDESYVGKITSPTTIEDYFKCPYMAFASHGLKIKKREEGEVGTLSVGNVMHEILRAFVTQIDAVSNEQTSDELFNEISKQLLEKKEYKKFLSDSATKATLDRVLNECKKYCYKTYLTLSSSDFSECKTEVGFGEGRYFPPLTLAGGKIKLKGTIDRVDISDDYFRVIDYKTGKVDATDKALFSGTKLQLYLYSAAVKEKFKEQKSPAGLYYMPISDKYDNDKEKESAVAVGKTLDDEQAVITQDKNFFDNGESLIISAKLDKKEGKIKNAVGKDALNAYVKYALSACNLAAESICSGTIKASPYKGACEYCEYASLCGVHEGERTIGKVNETTITGAVNGGEE